MRQIALLLAFLAVAWSVQAAVSSQQALEFVSNNFLLQGETTELLPNVQIAHARQKFWVVSAVSGESLNSIVPVTVKDPAETAKSVSERRELIRTGFILRNYSVLKDALVKQDNWLFSAVNARFLEQVASELNDEKFDLTTVRSELIKYPEIQGGIDLVQERLDDLKISVELLSKKTTGSLELEASYFKQPDTNTLNALKSEFDGTTSSFSDAQSLLDKYLSELDKVKQAVAQTELSIDTKRSLGNLLAVPARLQRLPSMTASATLFEEKLQEIFDNALSRREALLANLETRIERNKAFQALFGSNQELIEKTNGDYSSLKEAVESIFSSEFELLWKEQNDLAKLKEDWKKAQAYFDSANYALAAQFAKTSTNSAIRVYKAGFTEQEQQGANTSLLINGIILLVILLIILFALRNRKKLWSIVSEPMGEKYE